MGSWRLEALRLWRTRRLLALAATFLLLGLVAPVVTYYLPDLVRHAGHGNGIQITIPKQTPADGLAAFASNVAQLGTLIVVVVAAATLAIDATPALAAFYRTRLRRPLRLVGPRYVAVTSASIVTLALGTFAAWYETTVLLGSLPPGRLLGGLGLGAIWLCFVTSVVAAFASAIRSVLGVVGGSIALLLGLALLGNIGSVSSWLPTRLSSGVSALVQHSATDIWHAVLVAVVATAAALVVAVNRFGERELYPARATRIHPRRQPSA